MSTLVIRLSSLGDVVLAGAVTGPLAPVSLLTRAAWAPVAARLPGVARVLIWEEMPSLAGFDRVVDLHASPRSRLAALRAGAPVSRVRRYDLLRRARVAFKVQARPPTVIARYAEAAGVEPAPAPWIRLERVAKPDTLVLVPGAAHATKRWPAARFVALGARWPGPVTVLGSWSERALALAIVDALGPSATAVCERGFDQSFSALGEAAALVGGDTGLLHLAAACGVPVLGLFGPTTSQDGFWCWDAAGRAVELPLSCRPCSRHGSDRCPIGDHRCLAELSPEAVWAQLEQLLAGRGP